MTASDKLVELLKIHEGFRAKVYKCTAGKLTIGYGLNVEDKGLTEAQAEYLLRDHLAELRGNLGALPWFQTLDDVRQAVVIDMAYNLGIGGLLKFQKMISWVRVGNFKLAAGEMRNSRWYNQVGQRAKRLTYMMQTGHWPEDV